MHYITAKIRPTKVYHGYTTTKEPIIEDLPQSEYVKKVIKLERILSFTEDHIFIQCPHDTVQTWEYEGDLESIEARLRAIGALV